MATTATEMARRGPIITLLLLAVSDRATSWTLARGGDDPNSCAGRCGSWAENCWCNDACTAHSDCCADYQQQCGGGGEGGALELTLLHDYPQARRLLATLGRLVGANHCTARSPAPSCRTNHPTPSPHSWLLQPCVRPASGHDRGKGNTTTTGV